MPRPFEVAAETIRDKAIQKAAKRRQRQLRTLRVHVSRREVLIEDQYRAAVLAAGHACSEAINKARSDGDGGA